ERANDVTICPGPIKRREFLRIGLAGFATLSLPGLFELRARAAAEKPKARTAVILVWLRGAASHLETYDPKPDAPSEFRGVFSPISPCSGHADFRVAATPREDRGQIHITS